MFLNQIVLNQRYFYLIMMIMPYFVRLLGRIDGMKIAVLEVKKKKI